MADNPDQSKTILVVDDSEDDILLLRRLLKMARIANPIVVAHGGEETLAHLKGEGKFADRAKHPVPAVLILDLKMPRVDGFMVLQWIKQQPHLKQMLVIVLSAVHEIQLVNRAYELGAKTFLTKPCGAEDLSNLIFFKRNVPCFAGLRLTDSDLSLWPRQFRPKCVRSATLRMRNH